MVRYVLDRPVVGARPSGHDDFERQLNDEQRAVVRHRGGPMLVIAGAGTGKTRTIVHRLAHLLEQGVAPERILVCTFTNRAAREMLRRVEERVGPASRRVWSGTFHHIAHLALRSFGRSVGLPQSYGILDREDAKDMLQACLAAEGKALTERRFPQPAVLLGVFSLAINCNLSLAEAVRLRAPRFLEQVDDIERLRRRFTERKIAAGMVDFDDLLLLFRHLLVETSDARALCERFLHVLVDEYQDTNLLQAEIVDRLASTHRNVMVVGDDAQSIYSFRGADLGNILGFAERWPNAVVFKLVRNYRSTPEILAVANRALSYNVQQFEKDLQPTRSAGATPVRAMVHDAPVQAAFVAQRVLELHQEFGVPLHELAVLYRAHSHSIELQVELARRQIPFAVRSGLRFFEQAHIKDALAYLRVIHNARDELAWGRLLRHWAGFGGRGVARVRQHALSSPAGTTAFDLLRQVDVAAGARASRERLAGLIQHWNDVAAPSALLRAIVAESYGEVVESTYDNARARLEDLDQLAQFAGRFDSLAELLAELALVAGIAAEGFGPAEALGPPDDAMVLSTVHQAKGLEWKSVFVLSLCEGRFPQPYALGAPEQLEEERRLFYVAVTRARDELYLVTPGWDDQGDGRLLLRASRFVREIEDASASLLERWEIEETTAGGESPAQVDDNRLRDGNRP